MFNIHVCFLLIFFFLFYFLLLFSPSCSSWKSSCRVARLPVPSEPSVRRWRFCAQHHEDEGGWGWGVPVVVSGRGGAGVSQRRLVRLDGCVSVRIRVASAHAHVCGNRFYLVFSWTATEQKCGRTEEAASRSKGRQMSQQRDLTRKEKLVPSC